MTSADRLRAAGVCCAVDAQGWVRCPVCGCKATKETYLKNFPLFCPKCHRETVVSLGTEGGPTVRP